MANQKYPLNAVNISGDSAIIRKHYRFEKKKITHDLMKEALKKQYLWLPLEKDIANTNIETVKDAQKDFRDLQKKIDAIAK